MSIHAALAHRTHYTYDRAVVHGPHVVRLRPAPHCKTKVLSYSLKVSGGEVFINWQQDPFSNWNARLVFPEPIRELLIEVELVVEMAVHNPFDFFLDEHAKHVPFTYEASQARELTSFFEVGPGGPRLEAYAQAWRTTLGTPAGSGQWMQTLDFLVELNQALQRDVSYLIRLEPGVQTPEETLEKGSGSCRDSAWLMCQLLRRLGFASRFASGYLIQLKPDVKALDGPSGTEVDFTDLHAWCEVFLPGAGWIGFDPTSGLLAGEGHIPLSCTPEPGSAAPVSGALGKCESHMEHSMTVTRIHESPRVTLPYSEAQWEEIMKLGRDVDARLLAEDVRLTMGGEPTFVSVDQPDAPEWNFSAVSQKKRELSGTLLKRLQGKFAPGALLHYGQGKWYPCEPLPRYALSAFWRNDGFPVWKNPKLIADESKDYGYGLPEAKKLGERLARILGIGGEYLQPGYEDPSYYLWRESRLPSNVIAEEPKFSTPGELERFRRLFKRGLKEEVGYVLPLQKQDELWRSSRWFFREDGLLRLSPGDSPMGLRLPLDSLPWVSAADYPHLTKLDPSQKLPPLPTVFGFQANPVSQWEKRGKHPEVALQADRAPLLNESAPWIVRTALCVEPRHGRLYVFLPPLQSAEDFVELIAALELAVRECSFEVVIEGETPPPDPRLNKLGVTPDPGVIEVNLHPSATWDQLVERTEVLYEEAHQSRLGTEKFMLDGRHTGTGGGNHIILGGATPGDSPVLRRPDLLRSLLTYWQNHPSLSWLFSGLFIGPTSQAPRIDESRHDSLYELELAFEQIPGPEEHIAPWLVDRLFRNLLTDASGNTHRAEFSIDKLYSPDSATGRLGLLEMRAFEMPPHARMSLVQQLLLRGMVSMFWKKPYTNNLIRWGTDLHDRWLLPHFCDTDFREVLGDLRDEGYTFEKEWFAPHFEFRFPHIGHFEQRDIRVELRAALEPWHVLGEEPAGGGAVRYVDSSLERLQVKVNGMAGDRFALLCNGRRVPLHPTGTNTEAVAAVRYRAWQPPGCLHPTIPPHAPLVFDLYDTWSKRSLGGCRYHVAHPGGLSYDTFPVNAYEAESRRLSRFLTHGHTQGVFLPVEERLNPECPFTLDLRKQSIR